MTHIGGRARDDDAVPTPQRADDLVGVALRQPSVLGKLRVARVVSLMPTHLPETPGSGYAGLG